MIKNQILRCVVGSQMYGLATDNSDRDEAGIFMETPQEVCGLHSKDVQVYRDKPAGVKSEAGDLDLSMYSLRKFVKLAVKGNPSILQILYSPEYILLEDTGKRLIDFRHNFYSHNAGKAFLGYLVAQRMKMTGERSQTVNRPELVEKYGYDTKFAMQSVRLGLMGLEYMKTKHIQLPMKSYEITLLKSIKAGKVPFEKVLEYINELEKKLKEEVDKCTVTVNEERINNFLADNHILYWFNGKS